MSAVDPGRPHRPPPRPDGIETVARRNTLNATDAHRFCVERDEALAEVERLQAENANLMAIEVKVISGLKRKLEALAVAVRPVLRAHCSTTGHVTEEQITAAWDAYDAARRDD